MPDNARYGPDNPHPLSTLRTKHVVLGQSGSIDTRLDKYRADHMTDYFQ